MNNTSPASYVTTWTTRPSHSDYHSDRQPPINGTMLPVATNCIHRSKHNMPPNHAPHFDDEPLSYSERTAAAVPTGRKKKDIFGFSKKTSKRGYAKYSSHPTRGYIKGIKG